MKNKKEESIHIRMTPKNKSKIQKSALKHNMTITQYLTELGLHGSIDEDRINGAEAYVAYCEFKEYCIERFGCAGEIMKKGDEIWDTIVSK